MTPLSPSINAHRHSMAGSALIMVIWLIAMLGMIVYAMHSIISQDMSLTIAQKQAFRARQVAEMGINWAMNPAIKKYDRELLEQTLEDGATFSARIRGEGGRMNINALLQGKEAERTFMTTLFALWGVANDSADTLFDRMVDWVDTDSTTTGIHGWEKDDYVGMYGQTTPYPFNRPFYNLEELLLVPGFDEVVASKPDWRDYFTIYSSSKAVDVNAAEAKVLATVLVAAQGEPDLDDLERTIVKAQDFITLRWGADGIEDTEDDDEKMDATAFFGSVGYTPDPSEPNGPATYFGGNDQTTHIECVATVGDYRKRVVLVVRGRTGTPQILTREEVPLFQ